MISIPDLNKVKNVLILRSEGSLGDSILNSCYYREFKQINPDIKISVVCFGAAYQYLSKIQYIDKIYRLPIKRVLRPNQKWFSLLFYGLKLGAANFDFILDDNPKPQKNWYFFRKLLGEERIFDTSVLKREPETSQQRTKMMLDAMGLKQASIHYEIPLDPAAEKCLASFMAQRSIEKYIAFNIFGSVLNKSLTADNAAFIADSIKQYSPDINVIVPVMPGMLKELQKTGICGLPYINVYETHTVFDLFSVLNSARFVISPDTAAVHISTGLDKAGIFFYPSTKPFCEVYNPASVVMQSRDSDINNFDRQLYCAKYKEMAKKYL